MTITLAEVAKWIGAKVDGDDTLKISGLAKIEDAQENQLTFIANPKYVKHIESTSAAAVLVDSDFPSSEKTLLRIDNPYFAFLKLAQRFYKQEPQVDEGIHPSAIIGENTKLGEKPSIAPQAYIGRNCKVGDNVTLYPGVFIGDNVEIGDNVLIYANVSVREQCKIGNNVIIHMGAVIGSDGFGFAFENGKFHKLPQMGIVVLEDDVEIGANATIDRATLGETTIKQGAKIDNLVQIAHNVVVGEHSAVAAQAGISGSTKIGKYVKVGGQAGFVGHIEIGDQAAIGAQAGVTKDVPEKQFVSGYPAKAHMTAKREEASLAKLPELIKKIRSLEKQIKELSEK